MDLEKARVIGLCKILEELLDGKRFLREFGNEFLLGKREIKVVREISDFKKELLSLSSVQAEVFKGYKIALVSLLSKLTFELKSFKNLNPKLVEFVDKKCGEILEKLWHCNSFGEVKFAEWFKRDVELMILSLLK